MGRLTPAQPTPWPGDKDETGDGGLAGLLQKILDVLAEVWKPGQSDPHVDTIYLDTGSVMQPLYPNTTKLVKGAIIQNISIEPVTIHTFPGASISLGIILNAADAAGNGGGSIPVGNIDLAEIYFTRTSAGWTLAVYSET